MQPGLPPFGSFLSNPISYSYANGELSREGFDSSRLFFLASLWLFQGSGNMDLSKVGEKILSSVRSARSLGLLPSTSLRPEVPARAAAAAAVARALASLPPHQRIGLPSSSEELSSIYGSRPHDVVVEALEEEFYEEEFDPVKYLLEQSPSEENELEYYEKKATVKLAQLDQITERLSKHVMAHHEEMVKGMHLVRELERDLQIAAVICMNGRRHLTSSMNEVSQNLIVTSNSRKKQALLDMLPVLTELGHGLDLQRALETHVEEENYCKAFQVLSEYLQVMDSHSELSAIQEMSRNVEVWLEKTLQKLDSLLLQVCQEFKEEKYITVVDAYSLIGDISGLTEKIQSFFMQEVLSETHTVLKTTVQEDQDVQNHENSSRLTYSDLCLQIPEPKFRQCLFKTLAVVFRLMCSYYAIMNFKPEIKLEEAEQINCVSETCDSRKDNGSRVNLATSERLEAADPECSLAGAAETNSSICQNSNNTSKETMCEESVPSSSGSPWYDLRKDAMAFVSQSLLRGRKNLWQLTTSRISVLLQSAAFISTSIHQFLRNYEDLNTFILAGEAFCGVEATEFRSNLKVACGNYFANFHRQNIYGLKMVLERENWQQLPPEAVEVINFSGLVGDGAASLTSSDHALNWDHHSKKLVLSSEGGKDGSGFSEWLKKGNSFLHTASSPSRDIHASFPFSDGGGSGELHRNSTDNVNSEMLSARKNDAHLVNGNTVSLDEENEDLLADFIDEDSQLPSRISKPGLPRSRSTQWKADEVGIQTGSSLCLLKYMDKYTRLMQKLEVVNVDLFKGIFQLFALYYHFVFEAFGQHSSSANGKGSNDSLNYRLKTALNRAAQDYDQWIRPQAVHPSSSQAMSFNTSFKLTDVTPTSPPHPTSMSFGLKERCTGAESISLVAQILHRAKPHLQSMLLQNNAAVVEDLFENLVDSVPDLTEHIHRTTARLLLQIDGYVVRIANSKWELKELGMEHNGYVDLLLGEFKHYKTRLAHGGIHTEIQELLLEYGVEIVAETLVEGLSRVKRCTDEGRALMSLDLQVLINGLRHFVPKDTRPKLQIVEAFIKAYYLPETEFVHWARAHPEYTKSQIIGLINLVALMKGWKRKTRLEILEKIE